MIDISTLKVGDIIEQIRIAIRHDVHKGPRVETMEPHLFRVHSSPSVSVEGWGMSTTIQELEDPVHNFKIYQKIVDQVEEAYNNGDSSGVKKYGWINCATYRKLDDVEIIANLL